MISDRRVGIIVSSQDFAEFPTCLGLGAIYRKWYSHEAPHARDGAAVDPFTECMKAKGYTVTQ